MNGFKEVVRDGNTGGASYDVYDEDGQVIGRVDVTGPVGDARRRFYEVVGADGNVLVDGELSSDWPPDNRDAAEKAWQLRP